ncbi:hypothetical protein GCM10025867_30830 [Frondihabitans sucicola]|uniref:PhnB-like domain-containing protein n=1 Tax=Frondihabitans sucicola TaxID=1268041 RepID=A0ABM8GQV9_9MICO|nr:hypothetical protein GCM10025867_30830 [Frondihabitans sucicola]
MPNDWTASSGIPIRQQESPVENATGAILGRMSEPVTPLAVEPQLMFTGDAAAAMELYTSVFGDSAVESVTRGDDGGVVFATFSLAGTRLRCIDSPPSTNSPSRRPSPSRSTARRPPTSIRWSRLWSTAARS